MDVKFITVHCSATKADMDVDAKMIDSWHRQKGFLKIGYHFVIKRDGTIEPGRRLDEPGAHVAGFNKGNIGICMAGGLDKEGKPQDNFTEEQYKSLDSLLTLLEEDFPNAELRGHRDFPNVNKACPCFDVKAWRKTCK